MIRVLIADDHEVIRAGVRSILSKGEIELFEAANGVEAVSKTIELKPDLVILDLTMPVMGGYAAAKEIRRLGLNVPILFFTIHESVQLVRDAGQIPAQGYVCKSHAAKMLQTAVYELTLRKGTFFQEPDADERNDELPQSPSARASENGQSELRNHASKPLPES